MLVLTRHEDEEVTVVVPPSTEPTTFTVKLTKIFKATPGRAPKARLGFVAPSTVKFIRSELLPTQE